MKNLAFSVCFLFFPFLTKAQFFNSGQDPSFIHWRQIESDHFKIIFSSDFESQANKLINAFEYAHQLSGNSMGISTHKIPLLVHNYSLTSNGITVWAPKRIEIFPVSPQDIYPQDWFFQLSLHELRHVVQLEKINQGFTKFAGYLFGQQAVGGIIEFASSWFLEGDAVTTETSLSNSGRGRLPSFSMELRAQLLEKQKIYSFQKAYLGSYKDYIPDYYQLGYQITAYNRFKYGPSIWENLLTDIGRKPFTLFPLTFSIKHQTGLNKNQFYSQTFHGLDSIWKEQIINQDFSESKILNLRKGSNYTSYRKPQIINDSTIIAIKSSINDFTKIVSVSLKTGKEEIIKTQGISFDNTLSATSNMIVWSEEVPDLRWENRNYSIIKVFDLKKRRTYALTRRSRYFSPALSPDETKIATIEVDERNINSLIILDAKNGNVLNKIKSPDNQPLQTPSWDKTKNSLVMTTLSNKGKGIVEYDLNAGIWNIVFESGFTDISQPVSDGNYVLFSSGLSGIDNIYAFDILNQSLYQVTSVKFGAFDANPQIKEGRLFYSNYTSNGYDLVSAPLHSGNWIKVAKQVKQTWNFIADSLSSQEPIKFQNIDTTTKIYTSKEYSKTAHLFHVHSWAPFYTDYFNLRPGEQSIDPGITVLSQNLLGTATTEAGIEILNNSLLYHLKASYKGLYPIIEFSVDYGKINQRLTTSLSENYNEASLNTKIYVPLNLSRGYYVSGVQPFVDYDYVNSYKYTGIPGIFFRGYSSIEYDVYAYRYTIPTHRDIYPRFGQTLEFDYIYSPDRNEFFSKTSSARTVLFFPGFFAHHSIRLVGGIQKSSDNLYYFSGLLNLPRGFYFSGEIPPLKNNLSANYTFPLVYPDWSFLNALYIKRIRINAFYDYADLDRSLKTNSKSTYNHFKSTGMEITTDFHLFFLPAPINITYRLSYLPDLKRWDNSFSYGIILNYF